MRRRLLPIFLLLMAVALTGCIPFSSLKSQRQETLDDFIYALRWQRYPQAAGFFTDEYRHEFLARIEKLEKDLTITDVRLQRVDLAEEGRRASVCLEMDYFLLPSATIKTLRIDQTWVYFKSDAGGRNGFRITTPFPKIPGESSPGRGTLPP